MAEIPLHVIEGLPSDLQARIHEWWDALSPEAQQALETQWDWRAEDCSYTLYFEHSKGEWKQLPFEGAFVDPDAVDPDATSWEAKQDFFEYAINHEVVIEGPARRTFGICRAHEKAREALANGVIPHDFVCPLKETACPMRKILSEAPGKSFVIQPGVALP